MRFCLTLIPLLLPVACSEPEGPRWAPTSDESSYQGFAPPPTCPSPSSPAASSYVEQGGAAGALGWYTGFVLGQMLSPDYAPMGYYAPQYTYPYQRDGWRSAPHRYVEHHHEVVIVSRPLSPAVGTHVVKFQPTATMVAPLPRPKLVVLPQPAQAPVQRVVAKPVTSSSSYGFKAPQGAQTRASSPTSFRASSSGPRRK